MPELPEVETVVRGLQRLEGQTIRALKIWDKKVWFESELAPEQVIGLRLEKCSRRGKYIVFELGNANGKKFWWLQHLRMTGKMLGSDSPAIPAKLREQVSRNKQIRFSLQLEKEELWFWDTRRFGTVTLVKDFAAFWRGKSLAPDPLAEPEAALKHLESVLKKSERPIKVALLDQSILAGTGNIYADEALHRMRIHPKRKAKNVKTEELHALFSVVLDLFARAIAKGGTTANNYLNASGIPGEFSNELMVYDRKDEACLQCKKGRIQRIVLGGRSTHFCLLCQRK